MPTFVLALALACAGAQAPPEPGAAPARVARDPRSVGTMVLLGVELPPAGTAIGGHYQGVLYGARQFGYQLSPEMRLAWAAEAQRRGEALARGAGYRVRSVGRASMVAQRLEGVQFAIQGSVGSLDVRTSGQFEPYLVQVSVEVSWEVLDLAYGTVILGRMTRGAARLTGVLDSAIVAALDQTLEAFLGDGALLSALAAERPAADSGPIGRFTRPPPGPDEIILLSEADRNPSSDSAPVLRVAEGIVSLRAPGGGYYGTAILLSRDGLGVTTTRSARSVRGRRNVRAQFYSGVQRPLRVVRTNRGLGVALIQVACPGDCPTVEWDTPDRVAPLAPVLVVGAGAEGVGTLYVNRGEVGGRWGLAHGVTLDALAEGGEAVASSQTGRVFGIAQLVGERPIVLLLEEVLRGLKVRPRAARAP